MPAAPLSPSARMRLPDYYVLEALNSIGCNVFLVSVFVWAKETLGFSDDGNLWLGIAQGVSYAVAAFFAGHLASRLGPHRVIFSGVVLAAAALLPLAFHHRGWLVFATMAAYSVASTAVWPALEAAMTAAPGSMPTDRRVSNYNLTWSLSGSLCLFASGALYRRFPLSIFFLPVAIHLLEAAFLFAFARKPPTGAQPPSPGAPPDPAPAPGAPPDPAPEGDRGQAPDLLAPPGAPPDRVRLFAKLSLFANFMAYFALTSLSALMPSVGFRLGLRADRVLWLSVVYLAARAFSFFLFGSWTGWHYRWRWLIAAAAAAPLLLAAIFFHPSLAVVVAAEALFGLLCGLAYFSSLYYAMESPGDKGEGGGLHEAMIGLGMALGPLAGILGGRAIPHLLPGLALDATAASEWAVILLFAIVTASGARAIAFHHRRQNRQGNPT